MPVLTLAGVAFLVQGNSMKEIWKDIPGHEGSYQVSDMGNVFSLLTNKNLALNVGKCGYVSVKLTSRGSLKDCRVHRLVMFSFIGYSKKNVDHINGVKTDNRLSNLQYLTPRENTHKDTMKNKVSGLPIGVCYDKGRYRSRIYKGGKYHSLGAYSTKEDASAAYQNALEDNDNLTTRIITK